MASQGSRESNMPSPKVPKMTWKKRFRRIQEDEPASVIVSDESCHNENQQLSTLRVPLEEIENHSRSANTTASKNYMRITNILCSPNKTNTSISPSLCKIQSKTAQSSAKPPAQAPIRKRKLEEFLGNNTGHVMQNFKVRKMDTSKVPPRPNVKNALMYVF